jgi:branched-chain amino acid transport system permease protein
VTRISGAALPRVVLVLALALAPLFFGAGSDVLNNMVLAAVYVVMALGLNIIVGFAGLLDLGYVAFYALGAMVAGWWASGFFTGVGGADGGIHVGVTGVAATVPGIHLNFLILVAGAMAVCALAGAVIGLPTLRLHGAYIAIVTLAFGEIIGRVFANGDEITLFGDYQLSNGHQSISPIDAIDLPLLQPFDPALNLRPYYWTIFAIVLVALFASVRLRDSRIGRAWIALRDDESAAGCSGIPIVRTKLLAYATGAAFGGVSGAFLASYLGVVNPVDFKFSFSIFILAMVVLGGLGSISGVVVGAIVLSIVNNYLLPDVLSDLPAELGLGFNLSAISSGVYGAILVIVMLLKPQGLMPARRTGAAHRDETSRRRRRLPGERASPSPARAGQAV